MTSKELRSHASGVPKEFFGHPHENRMRWVDMLSHISASYPQFRGNN